MSPVLEESSDKRLCVSIIVRSGSREKRHESRKSFGAKMALVFHGALGINLFQCLCKKEHRKEEDVGAEEEEEGGRGGRGGGGFRFMTLVFHRSLGVNLFQCRSKEVGSNLWQFVTAK